MHSKRRGRFSERWLPVRFQRAALQLRSGGGGATCDLTICTAAEGQRLKSLVFEPDFGVAIRRY
jgi:hypothetical protein